MRTIFILVCGVFLIVSGFVVTGNTYDNMNVIITPNSGLPIVITNASTLVEESTATLNGYLVSQGFGLCQYRFEYDVNSGVPYSTATIWTGNIGSGTVFSQNVNSLSAGTLYYFRGQCKNVNGTNSGLELTFLTKPFEPTGFDAVSNISIVAADLSWTKGTGAVRTVVMKRVDAFPTGLGDPMASLVYNDTGDSFTDTLVSVGNHYCYRAWSFVSGGGWHHFSDSYDQDDVVVVQPVIFDLRSISVLDNIIPTLIIGVTVENQGSVKSDITVYWNLTRVDNGVILDTGSDTFAVNGYSSVFHTVTPSSIDYVGNVRITFTGGGDTATKTFYTESAGGGGGGGGGGGQPPSIQPPPSQPSEPVVGGVSWDIIVLAVVLVSCVFIFFIVWFERKKLFQSQK